MTAVGVAVVAAQAFNAGAHVVRPSLGAFAEYVDVGYQRPHHRHEVGFATRDDLLGLGEIAYAAYRRDRYPYAAGLLELLRQEHQGNRRQEPAGVGHRHAFGGEGAARYLQDIQVSLDALRYAQPLFGVDPPVHEFGSRDPHVDEHVRADFLPDGSDDLVYVAAAVLRGAAVPVGASVRERRQELGYR